MLIVYLRDNEVEGKSVRDILVPSTSFIILCSAIKAQNTHHTTTGGVQVLALLCFISGKFGNIHASSEKDEKDIGFLIFRKVKL